MLKPEVGSFIQVLLLGAMDTSIWAIFHYFSKAISMKLDQKWSNQDMIQLSI